MAALTEELRVQVGTQTAFAVGTTPNVQLRGIEELDIVTDNDVLMLDDMTLGVAGPKQAVVAGVGGAGSVQAWCSYEHLSYWLDNLLGEAVPAGTGVYTRDYAAPILTAPAPRLLSLVKGLSTPGAYRLVGGLLSSMTLRQEQGKPLMLNGDLVGHSIDADTLESLPSIDVNPIMASQISTIHWDAWDGTMGTTALDRCYVRMMELKIEPDRSLRPCFGSLTKDSYAERMWNGSLRLSLEFNSTTKADVDAIVAGTLTQKQVQITWADTSNRGLVLQFAGTVTEDLEIFEDDDGVVAVEITLERTYHSTFANWLAIELKNQLRRDGNGLREYLIAYWPLNEAGGANDALDLHTNALTLTQADSPGSATGNVYAAARTITAREQMFRRATEPLLETGDIDFAIALWVYPTTAAHAHTLVAKANTTTYGEFVLSIASGLASCWVQCITTEGQEDLSLAVAVPVNTWSLLILQHVAEDKTFTLYRNTEDGVASTPYDGTLEVSEDAFTVGDWSYLDTGFFFEGRIGPVMFWKNRVLDLAARLSLWNGADGWAYENNYDTADILVTVGDSITEGYSSTTEATRWANIVADTNGYTLINKGISGITLQNSVQNSVSTIGGAVDNNGRDNYTENILAYNPRRVIIMFGTNDVRLDDVGFSVANFQNDLDEVVVALINYGIDADKIVLCSPPWMESAYYSSFAPFDGATDQKYLDYTAAVAAVATSRGTRYADVYNAMANGGGASLISGDHIHPNDAGHAVIAATILAAMA